MPYDFPLGEETWVRRGIPNRDASFYFRECVQIFLFSLVVLGAIAAPLILTVPNRASASFWFSFFIWLAITTTMSSMVIMTGMSVLPRLSICPTWLYAEQLNPERLTIYHLRKPPTVIDLKGSQITRIKNRRSTTVKVADTQSGNTAILRALLPEEYDRFMQYWHAANA